jgi:hypothetical protein
VHQPEVRRRSPAHRGLQWWCPGCQRCSALTPVAALNDGELAVPADYTPWPKVLSEIQRPGAKQVREIYINPVSTCGTAVKGFQTARCS